MGRRPFGKRALTPAQKQKRYRQRRKANARDGGIHYWLTPPDLLQALQQEFSFDFDACPHPRPPGFDGLIREWGESSYVNPPFPENQPTKWARKALSEHAKGKRVVMVWPLDGWVLQMLAAGATVRNLGQVKWRAIEDPSLAAKSPRQIAAFILDPSDA
jgi:hypothetical protein